MGTHRSATSGRARNRDRSTEQTHAVTRAASLSGGRDSPCATPPTRPNHANHSRMQISRISVKVPAKPLLTLHGKRQRRLDQGLPLQTRDRAA